MKTIGNLSRLFLLALVVSVSMWSCKTTQKTTTTAQVAVDKDQQERLAWHKQKEAELKKREEELIKFDMDERARLVAINENAHKIKLNEYFESIAGMGNTDAATHRINETLNMFASADVQVLISPSDKEIRGGYVKSTTISIRSYLNFLKGQKKNVCHIEHIKVSDSGSITEIELKKNS